MVNIMVNTLVLSGGGLKTISFVGAFRYLEELNYDSKINKVIANSGGSILGFLFILGYKSNELSIFFQNLDISKLFVLTANNLLNFGSNYGIDDISRIGNIVKKFLQKKYFVDDITFEELYEKTGKKFEVIGTCLSTVSCEHFNYERTPTMSVLTAINISFAIPFLFKPIFYNNKYYVDGALTNNFPIENCLNDNSETMAIIIYEKNEFIKINNIEDYVVTVLKTNFIKQDNDKYIKYYDLTVELCFEMNPVNFNIDKKVIKEIIDIGYTTMRKKIQDKFSYMLKTPILLIKHSV